MSDHALDAYLDQQDEMHKEYVQERAKREGERQITKGIPERFRDEQQYELIPEYAAMAEARS